MRSTVETPVYQTHRASAERRRGQFKVAGWFRASRRTSFASSFKPGGVGNFSGRFLCYYRRLRAEAMRKARCAASVAPARAREYLEGL